VRAQNVYKFLGNALENFEEQNKVLELSTVIINHCIIIIIIIISSSSSSSNAHYNFTV
jgi:hypothetical protein